MVGLATRIGEDFGSPENEITHEVEFAVEASRAVVEQCFTLAGLLLDVDAAGITILEDNQVWHFNNGLSKATASKRIGSDLGFKMATSSEQITTVFNLETNDHTVDGIGPAAEGMKFFAGTPLVADHGTRIGAFWVAQANNRILSKDDRRQLTYLAGLLSVELQCHLGNDNTTVLPGTDVEDGREMLTICSWSKRIRENGAWLDFEEFLQRRLNVGVTHGISEDCLEQMNQKLDNMSMLGRV